MDRISSCIVFFKKCKYPATQEVLKNEDLLRGIFSYIDALTMMRLSEVSKNWQKHVEAFARAILDSYSLNPKVSQFFKFPSFKKTAVGVIGEIYLGVRHLEKSQEIELSPFPDLSPTIVADLTPRQRGDYLSVAIEFGYEGTVELLLTSGPISEKDLGWGVMDASGNGHQGIVELLLANGAIWEAYRTYAIANAAENGHLGIVKLWLASGSICESDRGNALQNAVLNGHQEIVELLLANGSISKVGLEIALKIADLTGHERIAELLRSRFSAISRVNQI